MEDDLNGRQSQWKTTSMEDDLNGRQPQWKMTSFEDNLNGRQPWWKTTSMEDSLNGRQSQLKTTSRKPYRKQMTSACLASKSCTELGPAQPQLVVTFVTRKHKDIASSCTGKCRKVCKICLSLFYSELDFFNCYNAVERAWLLNWCSSRRHIGGF